MKNIIILIAIVLVFGKDALAQEQKLTDFQIYSAALYLISNQSVEIKDSVNFLLDKTWIQTVDTYLNDLNKATDSSQYHYQKLYFPEIESLGVTFQFNSKIHAKAWLKSSAVQKFIKKTKVEISFLAPSWARYSNYYPDSGIITLSSKKHLDWYAVIQWLQQNYSAELLEYGYYSARIAENTVWEKYNPKPCADKCADYLFYVDYDNKDNIVWGHHSSSMQSGWGTSGWTWNYSISTRTFQKTKLKNPYVSDIILEPGN